MSISFKIIEKQDINMVIPLVEKLNEGRISSEVLERRFASMINENYECAGIFNNDKIIGVTGMWFCTRHYSGKSMEVDHVYIEEAYRNQGLGKQFMDWITAYVKTKGVETIELNTYVENHPSHKFYYNQDFAILGYHFLKKL